MKKFILFLLICLIHAEYHDLHAQNLEEEEIKEALGKKYEFILLSENYYYVELNGKKGICDLNGKEIIPCMYSDVVFMDNYYKVRLNGKVGICDLNGKEIIPCEFMNIIYFDGVFKYYNESRGEWVVYTASYGEKKEEAKHYCDEGDQYYDRKDYASAIDCYSRAIAVDDRNAYAYYSLGFCFYDCQEYANAISYFDKAILVKPDYTEAVKIRKNAKSILTSENVAKVTNGLSNIFNALANLQNTNHNNSSVSSGSTSINNSASPQLKRITCNYCKGTGKDPCPSHSAGFGLDPVITNTKCKICGSYENHYHKTCPSCMGKGYRESYF